MTIAANPRNADTPGSEPDRTTDAWRGFVSGPWQDEINVRDFIQRNYTPYLGDAVVPAGRHRPDHRHLGHG